MDSCRNYRINSPDVICEIIEDEAIIINLAKGHYFSIRDTGFYIWQNIESGLNSRIITEKVRDFYSISHERSEQSLQTFLKTLLDEQIIVEIEAVDSDDPSRIEADHVIHHCENHPDFSEPVLEKYTDMEQLLLLDPIHDVDEQGWPKMPEEQNE